MLQKELEDAKAKIKELEIEENIFNQMSSELYVTQRELDNIKFSIMPFDQLLILTKNNLQAILNHVLDKTFFHEISKIKDSEEMLNLKSIQELCQILYLQLK